LQAGGPSPSRRRRTRSCVRSATTGGWRSRGRPRSVGFGDVKAVRPDVRDVVAVRREDSIIRPGDASLVCSIGVHREDGEGARSIGLSLRPEEDSPAVARPVEGTIRSFCVRGPAEAPAIDRGGEDVEGRPAGNALASDGREVTRELRAEQSGASAPLCSRQWLPPFVRTPSTSSNEPKAIERPPDAKQGRYGCAVVTIRLGVPSGEATQRPPSGSVVTKATSRPAGDQDASW
jgi:hypothetical protein